LYDVGVAITAPNAATAAAAVAAPAAAKAISFAFTDCFFYFDSFSNLTGN
jgi:hypothetical protein